MSTKFSVGEIPLDAAQTIRKAWVDARDAHRVIPLNPLFNRTIPEYNTDGTLSAICYYHDDIQEVTEITFIADSAGSLDGRIFDIYSARDETLYKLFYIVDGNATVPSDTGTTKYVSVNLTSNDFKEVVAKATEVAIKNHVTASVDFEVIYQSDLLEITTTGFGDTTDASDVDTGFTSSVTTQGNTSLADKLSFTYDSEGQLIKTETASGDNITGWDVVDIRNINAIRDNIAIRDPETGNFLSINDDGYALFTLDYPTRFEIINHTVALADTEFDITLPDNTKRFTIKVRDHSAKLRIGQDSGDTENATPKYETISRGTIWESGNVNVADGYMLYLQSTKSNAVIEIKAWVL